ncbi:MAG: hemerythrin family protein [Alphaproteobacteria bacterium]|nr:hemerythrin family protein [Alphaproteobacteria bacterium]
MTFIAWQAEFETGIGSIDFEHQEMVELLNQLYDELDRDPDGSAIEAFLGEVFANISAHFALEEKIMRDTAYDEYRLHKQDHEQLLDAIRDIMDDHHKGDFGDVPDLLSGRLKKWFEEHFRNFDARLGHISEGGAMAHT